MLCNTLWLLQHSDVCVNSLCVCLTNTLGYTILNMTEDFADTKSTMQVQVIVTYGQDEVNQFIDLADAIENEFPELSVEGVEIEKDNQSFSVKKEDGTIVMERKSAGPFPEASSIIESLKEAGFQ